MSPPNLGDAKGRSPIDLFSGIKTQVGTKLDCLLL